MTEDKLPLTSQDVLGDKIALLQELFPEVFTEGKVDFERLKQALGEFVDEGRERYGLSWAGKSGAIRNLQAQNAGTLIPVPEESVNFETTENIFIEGDNLEVLKLLQKSYHNQIKMIYIDPPYNTGKEFIYSDHFREGLEDYLRYSGQKNGEGMKLTTNTETDGRFHSKWLNMMYPRLFLARNLLRDDGVIFISIDDHEFANLKILCDEIFGEENFVANVVWQKKYAATNDVKGFSVTHDYILIYQKSDRFERYLLPRTPEQNKPYKNDDGDGRGLWRSDNLLVKSFSESGVFPILNPNTKKVFMPPQGSCWRASQGTINRWLEEDRIFFGKNGKGAPQLKRYINEVQDGKVPITWWTFQDASHNDAAHRELKVLFDSQAPFDTPKPSKLVRLMLQISTKNNDIILDFFSGSSTTAHAVLEQNKEDSGNRKFIMIQLPEPCDENSEAFKAGYKNIADIGKERIRRVITKIHEEENGKLDLNGSGQNDRGFKVFKLTESNFKIWDGTAPQNVEQLSLLLQEFAENIRPSTTRLGMLYEILLKAGFSLTAKVEKLDIAGQEIYAIEDRELFICLEYEILENTVRQILSYQPKPKQFISLDSSFRGNDQLKTNTQLQMRDHDIKFRTV